MIREPWPAGFRKKNETVSMSFAIPYPRLQAQCPDAKWQAELRCLRHVIEWTC